MLENRNYSKPAVVQQQIKQNISNKKVDFCLPQVKDRSHNRKYSQNNYIDQRIHKENMSILPKIKIDSMPHIQQKLQQEQASCDIKPKRSQRVAHQKNTFLIEVQGNLKKVLECQLFINNSPPSDLLTEEEFKKNISANKNLIKHVQMKKVVSMAQKNVIQVLQRQSERKRQLSIQYQPQQFQRIEKQNDKNSQNRQQKGQKSQVKKLKPIKSAKNLNPNQKEMIKKCRSFQRIQIVRNPKKQNTSVQLIGQNVSLYKGLYDFLQKPNRQKQRQDRVIDSIEKSKQELQRKLQLVQQKLRQRMKKQSEQNQSENGHSNVIRSNKIVYEQLLKSDKKNSDPWSQTKFQKQWVQINNYERRNEEYLCQYLEQRKQLVNLQLKKKQSASKKLSKSVKSIQE